MIEKYHENRWDVKSRWPLNSILQPNECLRQISSNSLQAFLRDRFDKERRESRGDNVRVKRQRRSPFNFCPECMRESWFFKQHLGSQRCHNQLLCETREGSVTKDFMPVHACDKHFATAENQAPQNVNKNMHQRTVGGRRHKESSSPSPHRTQTPLKLHLTENEMKTLLMASEELFLFYCIFGAQPASHSYV